MSHKAMKKSDFLFEQFDQEQTQFKFSMSLPLFSTCLQSVFCDHSVMLVCYVYLICPYFLFLTKGCMYGTIQIIGYGKEMKNNFLYRSLFKPTCGQYPQAFNSLPNKQSLVVDLELENKFIFKLPTQKFHKKPKCRNFTLLVTGCLLTGLRNK